MAAVPLFRDTNMAAVTSRENPIYAKLFYPWTWTWKWSPGIDNIPVRVIKDSLSTTLQVITSLINASFTRGIFPRSWKLAVVSPILKDGNHEQPNNNRPISLLPILSKVCERAALNQITPYLMSNNWCYFKRDRWEENYRCCFTWYEQGFRYNKSWNLAQ